LNLEEKNEILAIQKKYKDQRADVEKEIKDQIASIDLT